MASESSAPSSSSKGLPSSERFQSGTGRGNLCLGTDSGTGSTRNRPVACSHCCPCLKCYFRWPLAAVRRRHWAAATRQWRRQWGTTCRPPRAIFSSKFSSKNKLKFSFCAECFLLLSSVTLFCLTQVSLFYILVVKCWQLVFCWCCRQKFDRKYLFMSFAQNQFFVTTSFWSENTKTLNRRRRENGSGRTKRTGRGKADWSPAQVHQQVGFGYTWNRRVVVRARTTWKADWTEIFLKNIEEDNVKGTF